MSIAFFQLDAIKEKTDKMKSMLDMETLFSVFDAVSKEKSGKPASREIVNKIIDIWAKNNLNTFLMFGEKLEISTFVEPPKSDNGVKDKMSLLFTKFPQYSLILEKIKLNDFISNEFSQFNITSSDNYQTIALLSEKYKKGTKITKMIHDIFKDKDLDMEVSKFYTSDSDKVRICASIDPISYLMMSNTKYNWVSCMKTLGINGGTDYSNVVLGKLMDKSTIVCYSSTDDKVNYSSNGENFNWYPLRRRMLLSLCPETLSIISSRVYIEDISNNFYSKSFRKLVKDHIGEYLGSNTWNSNTKYYINYNIHNFGYSDSYDNCETNSVMDITSMPTFTIGTNCVPCLVCGDNYYTEKTNSVCQNCM